MPFEETSKGRHERREHPFRPGRRGPLAAARPGRLRRHRHHPVRQLPDTDSYGPGCEALNAALDAAGLRPGDLDGLIVNRIPTHERFAEMMGINPQYRLLTEAPGRFSAVSLALAMQAIATGAARTVALVYGNNGRSVRMNYGGGDSQWSPWGMTSPGAATCTSSGPPTPTSARWRSPSDGTPA